MRIIKTSETSQKAILREIATVIKAGGLVVMPSDTVYGLCVDARSKSAVEKLISFKKRPAGKPISVFVGNKERAHKYVKIDQNQQSLLDRLAPGPYTFVLPSAHVLQKELESEEGNLGVRIPDYELINNLVNSLDFPITATSANIGGTSPHYSVASLLKSLSAKKKESIDLVIDAGKLPYNKPSTVIDLSGGQVSIIRSGSDPVSKTVVSSSAEQTQEIAVSILNSAIKRASSKPIIIILQGELGAGKTAFVKGIGEKLGITNIVSPTYVVCYEYNTNNLATLPAGRQVKQFNIKLFHHCDFYNIKDGDELNFLGIDQMLKPNTLVAIEWGEKSGPIFELLREKALVVIVHMQYKSQTERIIDITYL